MTHTTSGTPAQQAGLKVGDKIRIFHPTNDNLQHNEIITFYRDDESTSPWFKTERDNGYDHNSFMINTDKWEKLNMNTKEQILDQIAALQKFVEELDTPSEDVVRVYIKKGATVTRDYIDKKSMVGNVFDMYDSNYTEDVYTIWQDDEHSDYWMFNKSDCVVVEGEV